MRFFGILDVTDFGNQENLSLSLLHLQPAFGLLIVSFWHTQLGVEGFFFVWPHLLTAQLAELSHSEFDPKLFSHSAYVNFFVSFATKVPHLTFCDKM